MAGAVLMAILAVAAVLSRSRRTSPGRNGFRTAAVERRDLVRSVRITGVVEAAESHIIVAPTLTGGQFGSLTITRLAAAGAHVKKGDLLVEFDRQAQLKNALDKEAEYKDLVEQIRKKVADQAAARAKDDTELVQAEDALRSAELEVSRNEIASKIDAEKNLANLEEARARLKQLRATYELKRDSARADLRLLEIQRDRARSAMLHSQRNSQVMAIHSPSDGVIVLNPIWKMGQMGEVQEGDEVRSGVPFLQVMNPGSMLVRARANQMDVSALQDGQPVSIRLDAYPGAEFRGRLDRVAAIGAASNMSGKVHTYPVVFTVDASDPKLMPGLSAAVDVQIERQPDKLLIPCDAVIEENGRSLVLVKRGAGWEQRAVTLEPASDLEVAVQSGLQQGDIVLRNPQLAGSVP